MKPTLQQYTDLGTEMIFLCSRLQKLSLRIAELTGTSKAPYLAARKAGGHLDKCKSELDDHMYRNYPSLGRESISVFYGEVRMPKDLQKVEPTV